MKTARSICSALGDEAVTSSRASTAWGSFVIDFQGVAGLIDTVLGTAPERLESLLKILWSSNEQLEARVVLEIVVRCRDPLAPLKTLCRDGLQATAHFEKLCNQPKWRDVADICPPGYGRANAILNLCDAALKQPSPDTGKERRERIRRIRPRVKVAAVREMNRQRDEIERIRDMRAATLPHLWMLLEAYGAQDKNYRRPKELNSPAATVCIPL